MAVSPFTRFSGLLPLEDLGRLRVAVIGAGGIGMPAALALGKAGVARIALYDGDSVAEENLGTQLHAKRLLGVKKVQSAEALLRAQCPWVDVTTSVRRVVSTTQLDADVVVAAVDSLTARRDILSAVLASPTVRLLVDPRMGAEVLSVASVSVPDDVSWYNTTLTGEAVQAPCTAKSTFYTGLVAGGMAAQAVVAWLRDERVRRYTVDLRNIVLVEERR